MDNRNVNEVMDVNSAVTLIETISNCHLTKWERGFLDSCCVDISQGKDLRPNQLRWIETIFARKKSKGLIKEGRAA